MESLADFKGKYAGKRIFLLGSGYSLTLLTGADKAALSEEYTFAGARFFKWKEAGFIPSFYILSEQGQAEEWKERGYGGARATIAKFFVTWQPAPSGWVPVNAPPSLSYHHYTLPDGRLSPFEGECDHIHMAHDVPLAMLQVARYMGFTSFYLLGCETTAGGYAWDKEERRKVGDRLGTMAPLYRKARQEVGALYDCTPGGRLNGTALEYVYLPEVLYGQPARSA